MLHRDLHVNTICALFNADVLAHGSWFFSLGSWPFGYTCIHPSIYPTIQPSIDESVSHSVYLCIVFDYIALYCIVLRCILLHHALHTGLYCLGISSCFHRYSMKLSQMPFRNFHSTFESNSHKQIHRGNGKYQ